MHFLGDVFIQEEPLSFIAGCFSLSTLLGPFAGEDIWGEQQDRETKGAFWRAEMDSGRGLMNGIPYQIYLSASLFLP